MDTTNSSEKPQRRVEDRKPAEVIDWAAPGAPAVPLSPAATSGDAPADLQQLKALALAATPQNLDSAQDATKPTGWIECPACGGEGSVELTADYCNYDGKAMGVQFYGIGPEHLAAEAFFRAASPAVVLDLIARIEREREVAASWQRTAEKKDRDWNEARMAFENYKCEQRAASTATASGDELPPPFFYYRANKDGSVEWGEDCCCRDDVYTKEATAEEYETHGGKVYSESQVRALLARAAVSAATKPTADLSTKITDTDSARKFLVEWHLAHFPTDRTFARYIMGDRENSLAGDFAWQLAKALATKPAAAPTAWLATDLDGRGDVAFTQEEAKRRAGEGCTIFYPLFDVDVPTTAPADRADKRAEILAEVEEAIDVVIRDLEFDVEERSGAISCRTAIRALKSSATQTTEGAGK